MVVSIDNGITASTDDVRHVVAFAYDGITYPVGTANCSKVDFSLVHYRMNLDGKEVQVTIEDIIKVGIIQVDVFSIYKAISFKVHVLFIHGHAKKVHAVLRTAY